MKNAFILTLILLLSRFVYAQQTVNQQDTPPETLFQGHLRKSSGYGALAVKYSSFADRAAVLTGLYGGWFINDQFMIGLGGYGMVNSIGIPEAANVYPGKNSNWVMGYGGLMLEYTLNSKKFIHPTFNALIGGGGVGKLVHGLYNNNQDYRDEVFDGSAFFVIEPGASIEVNITRVFRIGAGVSYRYVSGSTTSGISDAQMSAPSASLSLKFGGF